ncbi:LapA family protein [Nocardioides sp. MAHUQ-72]|uniref:LapA family protein n=1 Tax=unclassified Nocardioides TaxID=2615069 RepID=UPI003611EE93
MSDDSPTPPTTSPAPAGHDDAATRPESQTPPARTKDPLRGSRTSGIWVAVVGLGLVLLLLVVFIAQNTQRVEVSFLGWTGTAPLAVTLLIATAAGLFLAATAGSLRILQLRRRVRRDAKGARKRA